MANAAMSYTSAVVISVRECLARAVELESDTARLDVETLLAYVMQQSRTWLYTWPEKILTTEQQQLFEQLLQQRKQNVPVAYLTGVREFWSLPLQVNRSTLIPRPDTELLVELALLAPLRPDARVLDLGTGTGAVALALVSERSTWHVVAVDQHEQAVALARSNAQQCKLALDVLQGDWFAPVTGQQFSMIVSNPPYIAESDAHLRQGDVAHEPRTALVAADNGLANLQHIVQTASQFLLSPGYLLLEHGSGQGESVRNMYRQAGFSDVQTHRDLGGNERVTRGVWHHA